MQKYKPCGIEHGVEFLLPPNTALHFAHDLQKINVTIMGVDGWFYVDQDKGWIVQDLDVDLSIDEETLQEHNAVEKSVVIASRFIRKQLPKRTEFVSFTLDPAPLLNVESKACLARLKQKDKASLGLHKKSAP